MKKLLVVFALLLVACTPEPPPVMTPNPELVAARTAAGIPDCPATDLNANAVKDGLPKTALECLGGTSFVNLAGLERKPTLVNLWAQWCPPCRAESPFLAQAFTATADRVNWVGIDYTDPRPELAIEFAGLVHWKYPHVADQEGTLRSTLRVTGIPTTLLVDGNGKIVARHAGPFTSTKQVIDFVEANLGQS